MKALLPLFLLASTLIPLAAETEAERDARMQWWREARFGMFIHWGVYSVPAGEWKGKPVKGIAEWIQSRAQIPVAEYTPLKDQFNPEKYDADAWVRLAKDAGMKYIVITSKHHDGFCLWDSGHTDWDIASTPYKKDLLKPLAEACKKHGLKLCFYHSIMDWHHPDWGDKKPWRGNHDNPSPDMDKYTAYMKAQLKELLTNYGEIGIAWFDGEWEPAWTHERGLDLDKYVRSLQPDIIINNRVDKGRKGMEGLNKEGDFAGDYGTPEQEIPAKGIPGLDWESCMTMNGTWGYSKRDQNWKSTEKLIRNLIDIVSKGGNYLLNVGPTAEGEIPGPSIERLKAVGQWMKVNGESIHGSSANPFPRTPWGRCTSKPLDGGNTRLYLHLFDWPADGKLTIPGLANEVLKASLLARPDQAIATKQVDGSLALTLSGDAPDPYSSVVALDIKGTPAIKAFAHRADKDGRIVLNASDAQLDGHKIKLETRHGESNIGFWGSKSDSISFPIQIDKAGSKSLTLRASCDPKEGGGRAEIRLLDADGKVISKIPFDVPATGGWQNFTDQQSGTAEFPKPGRYTIRIAPLKINGAGLMNFSRLTLK